MAEHGTRYCYVRSGCRCEECVVAQRRYSNKRLRQMMDSRFVDGDGRLKARVPEEQHGRVATYTNRGCRCLRCTEAQRSSRAGGAPRRRGTPPRTARLSDVEVARLRRMVGVS